MGANVAIRLAATGGAGANLYNAYHFLTQLAGLYAEGATCETRAATQIVWLEFTEGILADVGEVCQLWETTVKRNPQVLTLEEPALAKKIVISCRRVERLSQLLNLWTPQQQRARILMMCERRWAKLLSRMAKLDVMVAPKLFAVRKTSFDRQSRMIGLIEGYAKELSPSDLKVASN